MDDEHTRLLLDTIRKELKSIINDNNSMETVAKHAIKSKSDEEKHSTAAHKNVETSCEGKGEESFCKPEANVANTSVKRATLFDARTSGIDEDLQRMQLKLQRSYELFQSIGDKLETINFRKLHNRIRDMQLHTNIGKTSNLNSVFNHSYDNNQLSTLSSQLGEQLYENSGEFGNIPEVSAFFQACTQLQNGLLELKKHRQEVTDFSKRLSWETENAHQRALDIQKKFHKNDVKNEDT